jgi:tetratricopeptide (TPR) repeat protein
VNDVSNRSPADQLVGRESETALLLSALDRVKSDQGAVFLISGEAGIGKSRLATEAANQASGHRIDVAWGRCLEGGAAPAYWPWVQCLRTVVREGESGSVRSALAATGSFVAQLVPEVREMLRDVAAPPAPDSDGARFRLFDAVTQFLNAVAQERPLLLVFDDLHLADSSTVLLLRFAAPELIATKVVILALYRDTDLPREHPLRDAVAELGRHPRARRLALGGLDEDGVRDYIQAFGSLDPPPSVVQAVHAKTDGNPLFVREVVRLLTQEAGSFPADAVRVLQLPATETIRDVIGRRLDHLSEDCRQLLNLAAITGREFSLKALERVTGLPRRDLLAKLDEARSALVVTQIAGSIDRWRFEHLLIRDVLYDDLSVGERVALHRRVAEALESIYEPDLEAHLAELAYHFRMAAPSGETAKAVDYAYRAGGRAASALAFEEAARLYEMAIEALDASGTSDDDLRCRLLLALGDAQARGADLERARTAYLDAARLARRLSRSDMLAKAALGYGGRFVWAKAGRDSRVVPLLREAVAATERESGPVRARLLARLAGALRDEAPREVEADLSGEAVELARQTGDASTLAYALVGRYAATWWPENSRERLGIASELVALARATGDAERVAEGIDMQISAHLELGEVQAVDERLITLTKLVDELRQPAQRWVLLHTRAMRALLAGGFDEAEQLIGEARRIGEGPAHWDAVRIATLQTFVLRREQDRLREIEDVVRRSVAEYPGDVALPCMLAHLYVQLRRPLDARTAFEAVATNDFADLPQKSEWIFALCMLPEVARSLGDARRAGTLYDLLLPFGSQAATVAPEVCIGSVSRSLGVLASVVGRWEEAEAHYEAALAAEARMGARPWLAHSQHEYARMLLTRDRPDQARAEALLAESAETAEEVGMPALAAGIAETRQGAGLAGITPVARGSIVARREPGPRIVRREGDYWTVAFEGDTFRLRDSKGLRYLSALLRAPGREILALELVADHTPSPSTGRSRDPGLHRGPGQGLGAWLDDQAKAEYRQRLAELEAEIAQAEEWADPGRLERARSEREMLVAEISRAVGLGGKDRPAASDVERARLSVTKTIRSAIARISEYSPALGAHLAGTIRTGTFCSYTPDPSVRIAWQH